MLYVVHIFLTRRLILFFLNTLISVVYYVPARYIVTGIPCTSYDTRLLHSCSTSIHNFKLYHYYYIHVRLHYMCRFKVIAHRNGCT